MVGVLSNQNGQHGSHFRPVSTDVCLQYRCDVFALNVFSISLGSLGQMLDRYRTVRRTRTLLLYFYRMVARV